jgi:hypothetical protein
MRRFYEDHQMKKPICKCHPDSPFLWASNPRESMFMQDHTFRAKGEDGTKTTSQIASDVVEKQRKEGKMPGSIANIGKFTKAKEDAVLAYKQFGTFTRAKPNVKPSLNKHEL